MTIPHGKLEVICGSMFSGKSEELIRRLRRAEYARQQVQVFKHAWDDRKTTDHVHAHSGAQLGAIPVDTPATLETLVAPQAEVIGIDEVQFFSSDIIAVIMRLLQAHKRVIVAGLDLDFRGVPFSCVPALLAIADEVIKLKAVCMVCGNDAHYTQRLVNGQPARFDDPIVVVGAEECYQARCRTCYLIDIPAHTTTTTFTQPSL